MMKQKMMNKERMTDCLMRREKKRKIEKGV